MKGTLGEVSQLPLWLESFRALPSLCVWLCHSSSSWLVVVRVLLSSLKMQLPSVKGRGELFFEAGLMRSGEGGFRLDHLA